MTLDVDERPTDGADWLFSIGETHRIPPLDGLVEVASFSSTGQPPEQVAMMEKAAAYGARAVFFESGRHGRAPVAQAFIFDAADGLDDGAFAALHKRLWSWGGVPLIYRTSPGCVRLFRCAHAPDFLGPDGVPICNPVRTLELGVAIASQDIWWNAARIRNGTIWDDPDACQLMLSAKRAAHRTLVESVRGLANTLAARKLLDQRLRRRLLILSLMIAYLEERKVLLPSDFSAALPNATQFFQVLGDGPALIRLLAALEERFNGHIFRLTDIERTALAASTELAAYARLIQGFEDVSGQLSFWKLYSFADLPVELISNIYQLFVTDSTSSIYTPPALVRLILAETLSWERLDRLMASEGVILDPACGSGVFLVESFKRLVLHWRANHDWVRPEIDDLRPLLSRVHGIDLEEGAVELAAFSLCLSLCDALEPADIRASVKLFPPLADITLHESCFFDAKQRGLLSSPVSIIVGNPPFASSLTTSGAKRSYDAYREQFGALADKQLAYLFLHEAMDMLEDDGVLAMIEPSGFLYNQNALPFRQRFFQHFDVREVLDFVSVRGLFKKGNADPKVVIVIAEKRTPGIDRKLLHAVFRRNGRATAEQGFDIDYYDLFWVRSGDAARSRDVWRANLLGGSRVRSLIERLREYPTLRELATKRGWNFGEGFIAGLSGESSPADHLIGQPLLPTEALSEDGIDASLLETVPDVEMKRPKTDRRFTPPLLLVKEHEDLHHGVWEDSFLAYKDKIVGFAAPKADRDTLAELSGWLSREQKVLSAYVAGISPSLFTQRATAILSVDILGLPVPADGNLDLSANERIIAEDIVDFQRDFIRLGARAKTMQPASTKALKTFDEVFTTQISTVYADKPLVPLQAYLWSGAICRAYAFGKGAIDWDGADALHGRLDALLTERRGENLSVARVARIYDANFIFLLKPDRHRFWTRTIALRDADDVLADLRAQGF